MGSSKKNVVAVVLTNAPIVVVVYLQSIPEKKIACILIKIITSMRLSDSTKTK
ncbi:hypothetical protein GYH73_000515 [Bacillus megaterium]|nr:hypothetical protein [Priestia megaterium]